MANRWRRVSDVKTLRANSIDGVLSGQSPYCLWTGDCREELARIESNSIDSIVTDAPYELDFMSMEWDRTGVAKDVGMWKESLRVLKPGGYLLAFSSTRTYHRMACAVED